MTVTKEASNFSFARKSSVSSGSKYKQEMSLNNAPIIYRALDESSMAQDSQPAIQVNCTSFVAESSAQRSRINSGGSGHGSKSRSKSRSVSPSKRVGHMTRYSVGDKPNMNKLLNQTEDTRDHESQANPVPE